MMQFDKKADWRHFEMCQQKDDFTISSDIVFATTYKCVLFVKLFAKRKKLQGAEYQINYSFLTAPYMTEL